MTASLNRTKPIRVLWLVIVGFSVLIAGSSSDSDLIFRQLNTGLAASSLGSWDEALNAYDFVLQMEPTEEKIVVESILQRGIALHHLNRLTEAEEMYLKLGDRVPLAVSNLAVLHHAQGHIVEALGLYAKALELYGSKSDVGLMNNYGAMLQMVGRHQEAEIWLKRAVKSSTDKKQTLHPLVNLATHWAEEGYLELAKGALQEAYSISQDIGYLVRTAFLSSPVAWNQEQYEMEAQTMLSRIEWLQNSVETGNLTGIPFTRPDRVPIYFVYNGRPDLSREIQEAVSNLYASLDPSLRLSHVSMAPRLPGNAVRIGFISKFFGNMEPHGMLLSGAMKHLQNDNIHGPFTVIVCPIPSLNAEPLSEAVNKAADEVVPLSFNLEANRALLIELNLDALVYADMTSEPITHFLGQGRIAQIQILFWGNPVTSGSPSIDYFVSGERLEPPTRTRTTLEHDLPYTEQVVLLEGQGIWYGWSEWSAAQEMDTRNEIRQSLGISTDLPLIFCPQSAFKIHPYFLNAMIRVLLGIPNAQLVLLKGAREGWTEMLQKRLSQDPAAMHFLNRVHWVNRTSAGTPFLRLIASADLILHPFPFGGSRTSADAIATRTPLVAMEGEALRGRMAASLLSSDPSGELMGCCVADCIDDYVAKAIYLASNADARKRVSLAMVKVQSEIWERQDVVQQWAAFLGRAVRQGEK